MGNYLAVDTASKYLSAVLSVDGKTYTEYREDCAMRHSTELMPAIDELFRRANATPQDVDFFVCVEGAGSFTGIRIGVSAIKGFALATKKAVLPVTTFSLAAYNGKGNKILALCDALHSHYYAAAYDECGKEVLPPSYIDGEQVRSFAEEGYLIKSLEDLTLPEGVSFERVRPDEAMIGIVDALKDDASAFRSPVALYVRKCQAEIEREKKL